jgi:hypothetical protein
VADGEPTLIHHHFQGYFGFELNLAWFGFIIVV